MEVTHPFFGSLDISRMISSISSTCLSLPSPPAEEMRSGTLYLTTRWSRASRSCLYEDLGQVIDPSASFEGPESVEPESKIKAVGVDARDNSSSAAVVNASGMPYPSIPLGVTI
jgi:hypothetical protein